MLGANQGTESATDPLAKVSRFRTSISFYGKRENALTKICCGSQRSQGAQPASPLNRSVGLHSEPSSKKPSIGIEAGRMTSSTAMHPFAGFSNCICVVHSFCGEMKIRSSAIILHPNICLTNMWVGPRFRILSRVPLNICKLLEGDSKGNPKKIICDISDGP